MSLLKEFSTGSCYFNFFFFFLLKNLQWEKSYKVKSIEMKVSACNTLRIFRFLLQELPFQNIIISFSNVFHSLYMIISYYLFAC